MPWVFCELGNILAFWLLYLKDRKKLKTLIAEILKIVLYILNEILVY